MFGSLLLLCGLACALPIADIVSNTSLPFTNIVVFGDSLSDDATHGAYQISNGTWPADPAYYHGEFSNGPVWFDQLVNSTGLNGLDLAVGGATSDNTLAQGYTGPNSTIPVPSMLDQVQTYLNNTNGTSPNATLFTIMVGLNDIFFNTSVTPSDIGERYLIAIQELTKAGAQYFLLAAEYSLGVIPYAFVPSQNVTATERQQYADYSEGIQSNIYALQKNLTSQSNSTKVAILDLYSLVNTVLSNSTSYGFNSSEDRSACLVGAYGEAPRSLCTDPSQHIFWDIYHPTTTMHGIIAANASSIMNFHSICYGKRKTGGFSFGKLARNFDCHPIAPRSPYTACNKFCDGYAIANNLHCQSFCISSALEIVLAP